MKKLLLSATVALMSYTSLFAQAPDPSQWQKGEDVSNAVGFGNLSFNDSPFDYWTFKSSKGSTTTTGGLFEVYDGADCDLFQYLLIPAGMYQLDCQAYYRFGTSWDADPNSYADKTWENLAILRVAEGKYDIESKEFTESSNVFESHLMPRLFEEQTEQLYVDTLKKDWDMSDAKYDQCGGAWGPCSVPGSLIWFQNNKYIPYDDGNDVVYNKVTFFVTEDTWVKVGIQKIDSKSADSFMATNFHLIYLGDAGEAARKALALKAMSAAQAKADALSETIFATYGALGSLLQDAVMDYDVDDGTVETINTATQVFTTLYNEYTIYFQQAKDLTAAIASTEELASATEYAGKADFLAAIETAKNVEQDGNGKDKTLDDPKAYSKAITALAAARVDYINSNASSGDIKNFSDAINNPFFCDNAYTPTWNEDDKQYKFNDEIESTWATVQEKSYSEQLTANASWIPICKNVVIAQSGSDEGKWVIKSTTWHGGSLGVTMQHSYPAIGGWTASPSGNAELLHQTVKDLPNGYYSMSALMCNAGADISSLMYVYIQNSEGAVEKAPLTQKGNPWWGGDKNVWRSTVWEKLSTGMVRVTDGKVTIGSSSDSFYAVTGFQLYYYGENPDFTSMIQSKLDAVKTEISTKLTFPGDIAKVNELISPIEIPVSGFEAYDAAKTGINKAEDYITTAYGYLNSWDLIDQIVVAQDKYEETAPEHEIYDILFNSTMEIGTRETDTYETAQQATTLYNALNTYFTYRNTVASFAPYNSVISTLIDSQNASLKSEITVDAITKYTAELAAEYKKAVTVKNTEIFASLGADMATADNPVDITVFLTNPNFTEDKNGWTTNEGSFTVDTNLKNSECYNANFNISQTILSLPAGCYRLDVQAFYRDGALGSTTEGAYYNWWYSAACDEELWGTKYVELYVKADSTERSSYVKSVAGELFTQPSYNKYVSSLVEGDVATDENGNIIYDENNNEVMLYDTVWAELDVESPVYPFDAKVTDGENVYWYPNSMTGANYRFNMNPEAYQNEVYITLEECEDLTVGLRKSVKIDSDWCIFDNFKLYYLGKETPTGVANISDAENKNTNGIFNLSGQRLSTPQKGINIINGRKYFMK